MISDYYKTWWIALHRQLTPSERYTLKCWDPNIEFANGNICYIHLGNVDYAVYDKIISYLVLMGLVDPIESDL